MDYAKTIFGNSLPEITYTDIENYFVSEREESDQIEFKSYVEGGSLESKISGLVRSIAAFLNSDGGILIWGAPKGEKVSRGDRKVNVFKGQLSDVPQELSDKDWIISKITDKIVPLPIGIRVQAIKKGARSVAVFEVDKSGYSPHQAEEKYFMRLDGQSRTAPHHYVEALFKKVSYPQLEAYIKPKSISYFNDNNSFVVSAILYIINKSLYPNEEGLNVDVLLGGGFFNRDSSNQFEYNHPTYAYYGVLIPIDLHMHFPLDTLHQCNHVGVIIVSFGGKTAPRKVCDYRINFNSNTLDLNKIANSFSINFENKLQSEIITEKDASGEIQLSMLGVLRKNEK